MGKRKTHASEDQYGEIRGQDRDFQAPMARGGMRGGGTAGSTRRASANVNYERHVPKFLQPYAHLLGKPQKPEDEPEIDTPPDDEGGDEDDNAGDEEAIQRALEENPELAAEVGDRYLKKLQACEEKEKGNKAFADKNYEAAVAHFTKCIELDPRDEVYFSNRSAAYASNGKYDEALVDAQAVLRLRPSWVKGHARLAAALYGLEQYGEAKEAYERALKLEPNDQALQRGYEKALAMELKHVREKKHIFKKARGLQGSKVGADFKGSKSEGQQKKEKNKNAKFALSFSDEELEEGGE